MASSWGEALQQYREEKRGPAPPSEPVPRYARTTACPLGEIRHPGYNMPTSESTSASTDSERFSRHGWGSLAPEPLVPNALLQRWETPDKDAAFAREAHTLKLERKLVPGAGPGAGANRPPPKGPKNPKGRKDLFDVLQFTDPLPAKEDTWMGNHLVDPSKGKQSVQAPMANGRKDLFDVLNQTGTRKQGDRSADSWIGNQLIDPTKGKAAADVAAVQKGRKDLFAVINQTGKLSESEPKASDSWIGHQLIDPTKGKSAGSLAPDKEGDRIHFTNLVGGAFETEVTMPSEKALNRKPPETQELLDGTIRPPPMHNQGRLHCKPGVPKSGRTDLFSTIRHEPIAISEEPVQGRRHLKAPGSEEPGKDRHMLYHNL